jgi:hypothetical protein
MAAVALGLGAFCVPSVSALEAGVAVREVTPELPIRLAGYAHRKGPAVSVDHPLLTQALALRSSAGDRFVFLTVDSCEVGRPLIQNVLGELAAKFKLKAGEVAVIPTHTHSAPMLRDTLAGMEELDGAEREIVNDYSQMLTAKMVEAASAALKDLAPATLEYGKGRATFAMNRRVYKGDKVVFGDNPDGAVDWDVPVLRVKGANGTVRAILFGYACHGTSIRTGNDFYTVSGEYMAYARHHLETTEPGAVAIYLPGFGGDADPYPRGTLMHARRHGMELAGAVVGVVDRGMRPIAPDFKMAYTEVNLPLAEPPSEARLKGDQASQDKAIRARAEAYQRKLAAGDSLPRSVTVPVAAIQFGGDLTFVLVAGEVVVDYAVRIKRILSEDHPWTVGYAYQVPCYIPSARLIHEGGYEADYSLAYYGWYGPFQGCVEELLLEAVTGLVAGLRTKE